MIKIIFIAFWLLPNAVILLNAKSIHNSSLFDPKKIKVVIDAGHGGKDPGAVVNGVREKDVVLKLAKYLEEELKNAEYRDKIEPILTRDKDVYLSLNARRKIVKKHNADVFISLHTNISPTNSAASGTEIFFVTEDAADNVGIELLVNRENFVYPEDENEELANDEDETLDFLFKDLNKRAIINRSIQLALSIEKAMANLPEGRVKYIRRAPFMVLKTLLAPAILIEIGYLSNANDRKLMQDDEYLKNYAINLAKGIELFYTNTLQKIEYSYNEKNENNNVSQKINVKR
ncbi:MAG TPA: N-acetylmuramoyl-L-alanine amidase [bacterium]|nr:N-acetylmuramoyl-L-alanine amidase [bacterium]